MALAMVSLHGNRAVTKTMALELNLANLMDSRYVNKNFAGWK